MMADFKTASLRIARVKIFLLSRALLKTCNRYLNPSGTRYASISVHSNAFQIAIFLLAHMWNA